MLKNSLLGLIFIAAFSACSPPKAIVVTPPTKVAAPISKVTWSIDIPLGWKKETRPDPTELHDVRRVLFATKPFKIENGEEETATLQVVTGHISTEESTNFSENILDIERNRRNAKVFDAKVVKLGEVTGVELIEVRQIDPHVLMAILVRAGAKGGFGVLASCSVPVQIAQDVLPECEEILDTLTIK